jgi:hypothetical protein
VLEEAGVLSWVQRIKRVKVRCPDLFGVDGVRVVPQRTSNAYHFFDPTGAASCRKSERPTGTPNQVFFSSLGAASGGDWTPSTTAKVAFEREGWRI